MLLAADEGQLALATAGPDAHGSRADHQHWEGTGTTLAAGDGAILEVGTGATLRAVGSKPVMVLVMTLMPAASGAPRPTAPSS